MSRTVIDLDDDLIRRARKLMGLKKKVDIVNKALEEFVQLSPEQIRWAVKDWEQLRKRKPRGRR